MRGRRHALATITVAAAAAALLATACSSSPSRLEQARERWEALGLDTYTLRYTLDNPDPPFGPYVIHVVDGRAVSVEQMTGPAQVRPADIAAVTVEDLFEQAEDATSVVYDLTTGIPKEIVFLTDVADGSQRIEVQLVGSYDPESGEPVQLPPREAWPLTVRRVECNDTIDAACIVQFTIADIPYALSCTTIRDDELDPAVLATGATEVRPVRGVDPSVFVAIEASCATPILQPGLGWLLLIAPGGSELDVQAYREGLCRAAELTPAERQREGCD